MPISIQEFIPVNITPVERGTLLRSRWLVRQTESPDDSYAFKSQLVLRKSPDTRQLIRDPDAEMQCTSVEFPTDVKLLPSAEVINNKIDSILRRTGVINGESNALSGSRELHMQGRINHILRNYSSMYYLDNMAMTLATTNESDLDPQTFAEEAIRQISCTSEIIHFLDENIPISEPGKDTMASIMATSIPLTKILGFIQTIGDAKFGQAHFGDSYLNVEFEGDKETIEGVELPLLNVIDFLDTISNAVKHGGATAMHLHAKVIEDNLQIIISDNGKGIKEGVELGDITKVGYTTSMNEEGKLEKDLSGGSGKGMGYFVQGIYNLDGILAICSNNPLAYDTGLGKTGVQIVIAIPLPNLYPAEKGLLGRIPRTVDESLIDKLKSRGYTILEVPEELKSPQIEIPAPSRLSMEP